MRINAVLAIATTLCAASVICAGAHFAMIIPSNDVVGPKDDKEIGITVQFTHPFEGGPQMQMDKPEKFGAVVKGRAVDLLSTLREQKKDGQSTWETVFKVTQPADYLFFVLPKPYWEPAEDKFIVHATKVVVDALAAEEGWDTPIAKLAGLPVEIVPMARPYSLYAGNVFTGQVLRDGKPVPNVEVEVEFWGKGKVKAPTDAHVCQVVKADSNGVFTYGMPKAGWWGFSAIMEGSEPIKHEGQDKKVEIAAVIWVHAYPME